MRNILKIIIIFLVIVLIVSIIGCSINSNGKKTGNSKTSDYIALASKKFEKFMEKYELANSTAKINLSPIISDMQDIKSEFEEIEAPENLIDMQTAKDLYLEGMSLTIQGFMYFQSEKSQKEVVNTFNEAQAKFDRAEEFISVYDKEGKFKIARVNIKYEVKTANVKYIAVGTFIDEVDAVYTDENGGIVEKKNIKLLSDINNVLEGIQTSLDKAAMKSFSKAAIVSGN